LVKCYRDDTSGDYIMNSSLNPEVFFSSKKDGLFSRIFENRKLFVAKSEV